MSEDFRDSLRTEVHDDTNQASLAALDAEEAAAEFAAARDALADALQVRIDAERVARQAKDAHRKAFWVYQRALVERNAEAES